MKSEQTYQRIWRHVAAIPPGQVASYGQIARLAGIPRGARIVGPALGRAPASLALPWHRVISASGKISLPAGSRARRVQIERLQVEGVCVAAGRVDMQHYAWRPTLDELLWGPAAMDPDAADG